MRLNLLILLAALMFAMTSCDDDDIVDPVTAPTQDIVEIAIANGYTSLAEALTKTNLVDDLQATGPFTVFAPTNEAFDALLAEIGQTSIQDVPASVLEQILLYHVVPASVLSGDISDGEVATLNGNVSLSTAGGISVNSSNVVAPFDVEATNGVIHTVDNVLIPDAVGQFVNTVLEPAYFNEGFTTLIDAAVKADVVNTLLSTPNLTIFAPTNSAFEVAGVDVSQTDANTLGSVLTYHVVGQKVLSSEIPREAVTLNGNELFFSVSDAGAFINGSIEITVTDIESGSGVVHVIDQTILPPMGNVVETAIELSAGGEFTSLIAALQRTANEGTAEQNLISVLSGEGPYTVFAPTNQAFQDLLDTNDDWNSLNDIPLDLLITVLSYHVVPARAFDKDLADALDANQELPTAAGQNLTFDLSNLTINNSSQIIDVNYNATNGIIHVIDHVLLPE